jgi:hypothetical protein
MSSARRGPVFAAILCLLSLPACRRDSRSSLEGSYSTISESEWNIILALKKGGAAEIQVESWAPGEYETRSSHKTEGRWSLDGNTVILEYDGVADRLVFDAELSLAILGYKGGAPGLIQKEAFADKSILRNYPLWKLPHRFGETSKPPSAKNSHFDQII